MSMRKVALFMMVSLDGFFEGVDHEFDWHNVDEEFEDFAAKQLGDADVLLFGSKTYQMMVDYWTTAIAKDRDPVIAGFMNSMPKLVFSRTLRAAEWQNTQIVKNHVVEEIRKLTQQPGKDLLVLGSNNLSVSLLEMGLLDEIRVMLAPVLIGCGNSLFVGLSSRFKLHLAASREFQSGNVLLTYQRQRKR